MGKRGNEHGQIRKEDLEHEMAKSSSEPKGPFQKASDDVLKKRRIVRGARKFGVKKTPTPSGGAGSGLFSSVSLKPSPGTEAASGGGNPFGGFTFGSGNTSSSADSPAAAAGGNPFGGFTFGAKSTNAAAPAASEPSLPAFAMPAVSAKPIGSTSVSNSPPTVGKTKAELTADEEKLLKYAKGFVEHIKVLNRLDVAGCQGFVSTFCALAQHAEVAAAKAKETAATKTTTGVTTTNANSWDSSRPLFGAKPLISPTAGSATQSDSKTTTSLFRAPAPAPAAATGGFSFNLPKTGAAAAPVPAFSFSTTPTPAVKAAAEKAAADATSSATKADSQNDNANNEDDEDAAGELEAADDNYQVLYKTKTKILHVRKNQYIKGLLKLEKHKESGKNRLVVRDETVGRVKMNTAITKGMPISKSIVPATKKKRATPIVLIKAIFDETTKDKPEDFKIITSNEEHENLYNELKKLV